MKVSVISEQGKEAVARSGVFDDDSGSASTGFIRRSKARQHHKMPTGMKRSIKHLEHQWNLYTL